MPSTERISDEAGEFGTGVSAGDVSGTDVSNVDAATGSEPLELGGFENLCVPPSEMHVSAISKIRNGRFSRRRAAVVDVDSTTTIDQVLGCEPSAPRIWMVGQPHEGGRMAAAKWADALPEGWTEHERGHYLDGHWPSFRFRSPAGDPVEVLNAASWFGPAATDADDVTACIVWLGDVLAEVWEGAVMLATPATTARDLWLRSLGNREFPCLPDDLQAFIRSTSGQGRIETFPAGSGTNVSAGRLVVYDARIAYAGCVRELGHGLPTVDQLDIFRPMDRGRYLVRFEPPADWSHVGILPVKDPDGDGWIWPTSGRWQTWADGAELFVAGRAGWRFDVLGRIIFRDHSGRPLDRWATRLIGLMDQPSELPASCRPLIRSAVRSLILHGLGAFAGRPHKVSHRGAREEIPAGASGVMFDPDTGSYSWTTEEPPAWPEASHPEWSSAVWARQRARLLDAPTAEGGKRAGMLSVARSTLLGVRTDAIYMTDDPGWPDDGKVGRFTIRADWRGDYSRPTNNVELWALKERAGA